MTQRVISLIHLAALLGGGLLAPSIEARDRAKNLGSLPGQSQELNAFTHRAQLADGSDAASIRFQSIKLVRIAVRTTQQQDASYCEGLAFRDPGGSMFCPSVETEKAAAYEATYSYTGPALSSDEYGGQRHSFSVYFRPDELTPELRQSLAAKKTNRAGIAGRFAVKTARETVQMAAIDHARSKFCATKVVDGTWVRLDASCRDDIQTIVATVPAGYLTVTVEPVGTASASR